MTKMFEEFKTLNRNTYVKIKTDGKNRFKKCIYCPGASRSAWNIEEGDVISICALPSKNTISYTILIAISKRRILAVGVVHRESDRSWNCFLKRLFRCYPNSKQSKWIIFV
jgi:hypothetical protein